MKRILTTALVGALTACSGEVAGPGPFQPVAVATVEIASPSATVRQGEFFTLTATLRDAAGTPLADRTVTWTTSDTTIATVTPTGAQTATLKGVGVGSVTISAAVEGRSGVVVVEATPLPPLPPFPSPTLHAFIYSAADGMVEISSSPGVTSSRATDINDAGEVVGTIAVGSQWHAFIWTREKGMLDLGVPTGWNNSVATAINQAGDVVGNVSNVSPVGTIGASQAFKWTAATGMVLLPSPFRVPNSRATDINNKGEIVGIDWSLGTERPVRWTAAKGIEDLGTLPGDAAGVASAINDNGQIVGYSSNKTYYDSDSSNAVLWNPGGGIIAISSCGPDCFAAANAIGEDGQVVGTTAGGAFEWSKADGLTKLDVAPAARYSVARGINSLGQVIVNQSDAGGLSRAFIWTREGGMRDLGTLPGTTSAEVWAINNKGEIAGYSR